MSVKVDGKLTDRLVNLALTKDHARQCLEKGDTVGAISSVLADIRKYKLYKETDPTMTRLVAIMTFPQMLPQFLDNLK